MMMQEMLSLYLSRQPKSITAANLLACNLFRLVSHHAAVVSFHQHISLSLSLADSLFSIIIGVGLRPWAPLHVQHKV